ncbi:MAG: hypothetical protein JWR65_524 [Massilia sp.]|jgi:putative addiction module killer protein|nr:hypothetical protein [Massilia sp.]
MEEYKYKAHRLAEFSDWLDQLTPDDKALVLDRIEKMRRGTFGDSEPVGSGISEARIHEGPGLRIYYLVHGKTIILLMHGGTKRTQQKDIEKAHDVLKRMQERQKLLLEQEAAKKAKEKQNGKPH